MKENISRSMLTNEKLRGVFKNNFKLVNQAIQLARFYIKSGHEFRMDRLLEELKNNPDENYVKELEELEKEDQENDSFQQE
jgi:hypothetical protein